MATKLGNGFTNVIDGIKSIPGKIMDGLDYLFNPSNPNVSGGGFDPISIIKDRLAFVGQFQTMLKTIVTGGKPLSFDISWGSWRGKIDLAWFEPHRAHIRNGLSVVFWVACALSCWRCLSSALGVGVKAYAGTAAQEAVKS